LKKASSDYTYFTSIRPTPIALEHDLPISFVGLGEMTEDLRPFDGEEFTSALFE